MKKFNKLSDDDKKKLFADICAWIDNNIETNIGWIELCKASELNHKELQILFDKHQQTSPMTYIRKRREESRKQKPSFIVTPNFLSKEE